MTDTRLLTQREAQERLVDEFARNNQLIRDLVLALESTLAVLSGENTTKRALVEALRRAKSVLIRVKKEGH